MKCYESNTTKWKPNTDRRICLNKDKINYWELAQNSPIFRIREHIWIDRDSSKIIKEKFIAKDSMCSMKNNRIKEIKGNEQTH